MKTFADCKVGDEMYIVFGTTCKIENITKISNCYGLLRIYTENYVLDCPKDNEKHLYMICTRNLAIKELEESLVWHQNHIDAIQRSLNDLKEI